MQANNAVYGATMTNVLALYESILIFYVQTVQLLVQVLNCHDLFSLKTSL